MENRSNLFKVSALTVAMFGVVAMPVQASSESAAGSQYVELVNEFIADSTLSGMIAVDHRYRQRDTGEGYSAGQDYTDYNLALTFTSGFHDGWLGADVAGYFSGSLANETGCSEMTLCDVWDRSDGQLKVTTAALKFKTGEAVSKFGYIQSHGIGTIGNVWSFSPGTYRGASIVAPIGDWKMGYIIADQHTAPWWETVQKSSSVEGSSPHEFNGQSPFDYIHSLGVTGNINDALALNAGIGHSQLDIDGDNTNMSYRFNVRYNIGDATSIAYDAYATDSDSQYDGLGITQGISFAHDFDVVKWNSEVRYVTSDNDSAVTPRTVGAYGSNNGTFSQWWDALSDWDQSGQLSWFNRASRNFDSGWFMGAGVVASTVDDNGVNTYDGEYAVNADVGYSVPSGALKGSTVKLHLTHVERDMIDNSDYTWQDVRFQVLIPYNFL
jgi:hypothetical protein